MQAFLLLATVALYATAKKKPYKDDSEEVNVNVQHRLKPFFRALEELVQEQKVNKWFDEARRKRHGAYINEFGPLILDVMTVVDTRLPIAILSQHVREMLNTVGVSSSTTTSWRYVGKSEEFDKNVADLGRKFAWRVFELLDKIRDGDHSNVEDGVLKRLRKVRHRLEKYWTRVSSTTSRPGPPKTTTTPFAEAGDPDKEL